MRKLYINLKQYVFAATLLVSGHIAAQCTGGINYTSASLNGTNSAYQNISTCYYAGERAPLTVNNIAPLYSFNSSGPGNYLTLYDASNNIIAFGTAPLLNITFTATGQYYLQINMSGPPGCGTQSSCHTLMWRGQTPCSGTPASANVVTSSTAVCVGANVALSLSSTYATPGITYQWLASPTGAPGSFTTIAGTSASIPSPTLGGNTFYQSVVTCSFSSQSTTATAVQVNAASPAVSNAVAGSASICPGRTSVLSLSQTYNGVTYQWYSSSSATGPWSAVSNATNSAYTATVPTTTYYTAILSCSAAPSSSTQVVPVLVTTVSPVPTSAVASKTYVCPNDNSNLTLANSYTIGVNYQWQASPTGAPGSFTNIAGANGASYNAAVSNTTHYQALVSCINAPTYSIISQPVSVLTEPTTTSSVPYFEGFEGITANNMKPNCSWSVTNLGGATRTYTISNTANRVPRTGTRFASFYYSPIGTNYFYTNEIWMEAGVTYSASVWYTTEMQGYNNWTDLSIMIGQGQTAGAMSTIVSTNGPAISNTYKNLSDTFQVSTSGFYNVAIKATCTSGSWAEYLSWDDLSVTIPCQYNTPSLNMVVSDTVVCKGQSVTMHVNGADNYNWSTGAQTSSITVTPNISALYSVSGTKTVTGCPASTSRYITVLETPVLLVYASQYTVCPGDEVSITAMGAHTYAWDISETTPVITVNPVTTTTYMVAGSFTNGCNAHASQVITVRTAPTVSASAAPQATICEGESATITGAGAATYMWHASTSNVYQGTSIRITPAGSVQFTVVGTDAYGCKGSTGLDLIVSECTGISEAAGINGLAVYPNPAESSFVVELNDQNEKLIVVTDVSGRVIISDTTTETRSVMQISHLTAGIYFVTVRSGNSTEIIKLIKQ